MNECLGEWEQVLIRAQDGVLGSFGHAELHDALGFDLDRFARCRVASDARFAIDQNQLAETGQGESVLGVLVGYLRDEFKNLRRRFLGDVALGCDFRCNLGFGQGVSHSSISSFRLLTVVFTWRIQSDP